MIGIVLCVATACLSALTAMAGDGKPQLAVVGATLIDVSKFGTSVEDVDDAVVLIRDGLIEAVGTRATLPIPAGARVIDARGTFLIPGLIDGFGALRTQGFADAYLYEGVTTVFVQLSPAGEDGELKLADAAPAPAILRGAMIGGYAADGTPAHEHPWTKRRLTQKRLTDAELTARVDQLAAQGFRSILIGLDVWPDQVDSIVLEAGKKHLNTVGEMAFTGYPYAARAGVSAFMRSDRYQTGIDLAQDFLAYSDDPEGPGGAPGYRGVCATEVNSDRVTAFGKQLADAHTALMPILSIEATADDLNIPSPWASEIAPLIQAGDLDDPVDPKTGAHPYLLSHTPERQIALRTCAFHREDLDAKFHALGVHFLAASGSPAFGIMPGAGMHGEMQLLARIGLSPREVLASATGNYSEMYGWKDRGLVEKGRVADMVLLSSDPRKDAAAVDHIKLVIAAGQEIERKPIAAR